MPSFTLSVPGLSAGQMVDFYVYHPFACGYTEMFRANPRFNQPLVILAVEDESIFPGVDGQQVNHQVHIRLLAIGNVTNSTQHIDVLYGS